MGNVIQPLWADCPALTRVLCVSYPGMSLAMMLLQGAGAGGLVDFLFDSSIRSVQSFHLWALCLSSLYSSMLSSGMSFLMGLFEVWMVMVHFPTKERSMGSTSLILWMCIMSALINMVYLTIMFTMSLFYFRDAFKSEMCMLDSSSGMWPLIMLVITLRMLSDPNGSTSFWGLAVVPNKWYPVALTGVFCLMNMKILWNFVAALAVGYAYVRYNLNRFMPAPGRAARIEHAFSCCRAGRCSVLGAAWVPAVIPPGWGADAAPSLSDFGRTSGQQLTGGGRSGGGGNFSVFSGQGQVLGEAPEPGPSAGPLAPSAPAPSAPSAPVRTVSNPQVFSMADDEPDIEEAEAPPASAADDWHNQGPHELRPAAGGGSAGTEDG